MKILGIQKPINGPIGTKTNIKVCPYCNTVLQYDYEDIYVKPAFKGKVELEYINCMECKKEINVKL